MCLFHDTLHYLGRVEKVSMNEVREFIEFGDLRNIQTLNYEQMLHLFLTNIQNFLPHK